MKRLMVFLLAGVLMLTTGGVFARNFTLRNNGSVTLTIRYLCGVTGATASWSIAPGGSVIQSVADGTAAIRYWADTGANSPACNTLAEFTLNGAGGLDFYDVSLVDGFNVAIQIVPSGGTGDGTKYSCSISGCTSTTLVANCPPELIKNGACCSACIIFGSPQYCCTGAYNTPATCPATTYSNYFKTYCPDAYSYAYDDTTSTYTCTGPSYTINFAGGSTVNTPVPVATPTPTPNTSTIAGCTVYQDCSYGGYAIALPAGNYTLSNLISRGVKNDDISSLKVIAGYKVTAYLDDNYAGSTLVKTADDSCLVDDGWNDKISSIKVEHMTWTVEAESYTAMAGVATESCSEGGLNVGWIDTGDWMAYANQVFNAGTYKIEYRVASLSGGTLSSDLNGGAVVLGNVTIPATGGWQTWTTVSQTKTFTAGTASFGIYAVTGGWNINWIRFTKQ